MQGCEERLVAHISNPHDCIGLEAYTAHKLRNSPLSLVVINQFEIIKHWTPFIFTSQSVLTTIKCPAPISFMDILFHFVTSGSKRSLIIFLNTLQRPHLFWLLNKAHCWSMHYGYLVLLCNCIYSNCSLSLFSIVAICSSLSVVIKC